MNAELNTANTANIDNTVNTNETKIHFVTEGEMHDYVAKTLKMFIEYFTDFENQAPQGYFSRLRDYIQQKKHADGFLKKKIRYGAYKYDEGVIIDGCIVTVYYTTAGIKFITDNVLLKRKTEKSLPQEDLPPVAPVVRMNTDSMVLEAREKSKKPCINGSKCKYLLKGTCKYYHEPQSNTNICDDMHSNETKNLDSVKEENHNDSDLTGDGN